MDGSPPPRTITEIFKAWQLRILLRVLSDVLTMRYGAVRIIIIDGRISKIVAETSYDVSKPVDNL